MSRDWRVHHAGAAAAEGTELELDPEELHHVRRVLRLGPGDALRVFDGAGVERDAVLLAVEPRGIVRLGARVDEPVEPPIEVVLFQGLCRPDRMDWVVQKGTELGLAAIRPLVTSRADAPPPKPARLVRWRRIAVEACKQSGRRAVPAIDTAEDLPAPPPDTAAFVLDPAAGRPFSVDETAAPPRAVWLAVGPERGFDPAELERWTAAGWQAVALGPRILRTETAGLVAASVVLARWGDLGRAAGPPAAV